METARGTLVFPTGLFRSRIDEPEAANLYEVGGGSPPDHPMMVWWYLAGSRQILGGPPSPPLISVWSASSGRGFWAQVAESLMRCGGGWGSPLTTP